MQMRPVRIEFLKSYLLQMYQLQCDEEPLKGKPQITFPLRGEVRGTTSEIHHCWVWVFFLRWARDREELTPPTPFAFVPGAISARQPSLQFPPHVTDSQLLANEWALSALDIPVPP